MCVVPIRRQTNRSSGFPCPALFRSSCFVTLCGLVVQLVRIPACPAGGRGFEPRPVRHLRLLHPLRNDFPDSVFTAPLSSSVHLSGLLCPGLAITCCYQARNFKIVCCTKTRILISGTWIADVYRMLFSTDKENTMSDYIDELLNSGFEDYEDDVDDAV